MNDADKKLKQFLRQHDVTLKTPVTEFAQIQQKIEKTKFTFPRFAWAGAMACFVAVFIFYNTQPAINTTDEELAMFLSEASEEYEEELASFLAEASILEEDDDFGFYEEP